MLVVGAVDSQGTLQSPGLSGPAKKNKKVEKEEAPATRAKSSIDKPAKCGTDSRSAKASNDARIEELDQKWSDQFNLLEALSLARTLDRSQEPNFQIVKVATTHCPPAEVVRTTDPFIKLADRPFTQSID